MRTDAAPAPAMTTANGRGEQPQPPRVAAALPATSTTSETDDRDRLERELAMLADVRRRIAASDPSLRIPTTTVDRVLDDYLQLPERPQSAPDCEQTADPVEENSR
ncbi:MULTISPECIES: hypothetical protein [Rhodococcus]|uniref:hypothetical protein n=1 Tax=Rhodococcus TaxID=1827 RepID=UPI00110D654C|nr:hypothetical protein [Rhodococcus pyridinivorans]